MDCCTSGFPVLNYLPEFAQVPVYSIFCFLPTLLICILTRVVPEVIVLLLSLLSLCSKGKGKLLKDLNYLCARGGEDQMFKMSLWQQGGVERGDKSE